jgi:hypothetical protein
MGSQVFHDPFSSYSPLIGFLVKGRGCQNGQAKQTQKNVIKKYLQKEDLCLHKGNVMGLNARSFR